MIQNSTTTLRCVSRVVKRHINTAINLSMFAEDDAKEEFVIQLKPRTVLETYQIHRYAMQQVELKLFCLTFIRLSSLTHILKQHSLQYALSI